MPRLIHYHYRRLGKSVTVYDEWLVADRPDTKVLLLESYAGKAVQVAGHAVLDAGAPIVWYVFPGSWHDIGRFHLADGTCTGWYTNLTTPAEFKNSTNWACTDLFLDLWTPVSGPSIWLDEDEFAAAVSKGVIDKATERRAVAERQQISARVAAHDWPPRVAQEIDLAGARALK